MVYDFIEYVSGFVYHNTTNLYYFNGTTFIVVTDPDYPATTVPGVVYLDGTIYVMDNKGTIYGSDLETPGSWNALNFITAEAEPSAGVAIAQYRNYVVALKDKGTEFFYDAANATGSPLARMAQNAAKVGCASGTSVASSDGTIFYIGKNKSLGRGIYKIDALQPVLVSTPAIDRILNTLGLVTVYAFGFRINGSHFYCLNCQSDNLTLVYDIGANLWSQWTSSTAGSSVSVSSLSQVNGLCTAVATAHGLSTGMLGVISGATPSGYNTSTLVTVVDANTFTYEVSDITLIAATGTIIITPYTQGYIPFVSYTYAVNRDLLQHETNGKVYEITPGVFQDFITGGIGSPIESVVRTQRIDGGELSTKRFPSVVIVGDQISTLIHEKHSNDDSQTFSAPRSLDLSTALPRVNRCGKARRMVFELHHVDNTRCRLEALELGD